MLLLLPMSALAFSTGSQVAIDKDGNATVSGATVMQLAGPTFYARLYWGDAFIRIIIETNAATKFFRATGEPTTLAEISQGDTLDVSGGLESGANSLTIIAASVKNSSVDKKQSVFSGKVSAIDMNGGTFSLDTRTDGTVTVMTNATTTFIKGSRTLDLAHIKIGDTISKAAGDYDIPSKTLMAVSVTTYIDTNYYKPKNFQGTLQSVSGSTLTVQISGISYTVNLNGNANILSKNKKPALLARFVPGDTVRIYGAIREVDDPIIDADIVRDLSL